MISLTSSCKPQPISKGREEELDPDPDPEEEDFLQSIETRSFRILKILLSS
jgi:hypothetical protein